MVAVEQLRLGRKRKIAITEWAKRQREKSKGEEKARDDPESLAWDLAKDLAEEKYYIKANYIPTPDHIAESPAFLLFYKILGGAWQLVIPGLQIWRLSSRAQAYKKLEEIATKAAKTNIQIITRTKRGWKAITPELRKKEA